MPTYRIHWKLCDYHPEERRDRRRDEKINSSDKEIGTGETTQTLQLLMVVK
jgi:hypothetical protein